YRNAVHWSVDRFFADFIGRADLSHAAIIYTSDHGQNLAIGSATHCSHQSAHPDEGRVPLFALTGIEPLRQQLADAGRVNFGRASHFALFPTLIELFGYRSGDFAHGYGRSLFEEIEQAQDFVSGDIMGIFSDQLWWTPIAGREVEMAAPSPVVR